MKENKVSIVINKPIGEVFEFTTNPKNTHRWVPSITEEVADEYPPKTGTLYRNRRENGEWSVYRVVEFIPNRSFVMSEGDGNFSVQYTYKEIDENMTELTFLGWVKEGELTKTFSDTVLQGLKEIMEKG